MLPEELASGFERFQTQRFARELAKYQMLASAGQHPTTFVISCCDSRVSPEIIFDTSPGDIFVMRNIANIVPPFELSGQYHGTSAALDFAVRRLRVQHIVVLGHSHCGGVQAFARDAEGVSNGEFIGPWLRLIGEGSARSRCSCGEERDLRRIEYGSIQNSLKNLLTFPWIKSRSENGELALHGAHFDVAAGVLRFFDDIVGRWMVSDRRHL